MEQVRERAKFRAECKQKRFSAEGKAAQKYSSSVFTGMAFCLFMSVMVSKLWVLGALFLLDLYVESILHRVPFYQRWEDGPRFEEEA